MAWLFTGQTLFVLDSGLLWAQLRWPLRGISGGGIADEIDDQGINKNYGKVCALSQFTYEFAPGIYGILGANGAGKSTLFGLLTDTVRRDSGEILWDGVDILKLGRSTGQRSAICPKFKVITLR